MVLSIELTDDEHAKLVALARTKKRTIQQCVKAFIEACQPYGGDWRHPMLPKKRGG